MRLILLNLHPINFLIKNIFFKNFNINYMLINNYILIKSLFLFSCLLSNTFRKKLVFFFLKKTYRHRYVWALKNNKFFKIKFNFKHKFFYKRLKNKKQINKIIKFKRLTGLFKRKVNLRITFLRKRSMMFTRIFKKKFDKYQIKKKFRFFWKNKYNYRVNSIELKKKKKLIIFDNRKIIRFFLKNKSLRKQRKLNPYLITLLNFKSKDLLNWFEFRLNVILVKSHFFNNLKDSDFFIKQGFISINNVTSFNIDYNVKKNDLIKFQSKYHYYMFYRNSINNSLFSLKKLNWAFYRFKKKKRSKKNRFFPKVYHWIKSNVYFGFDIPYFLEIDYVNLTIFILSKPLNLNLINYGVAKYLNFYLLRLYNWNYIT